MHKLTVRGQPGRIEELARSFETKGQPQILWSIDQFRTAVSLDPALLQQVDFSTCSCSWSARSRS